MSLNDDLSLLHAESIQTGIELDTLIALKLLQLLGSIQSSILEAPRFMGQPEVLVAVVQVQVAGTEQPGPDVPIPPGYTVSVRQRRHATIRNGYVAFARTNVKNTILRAEIKDNDSFTVKISNLNILWFDSDTNATFFELMVEYAHQQPILVL